MKELVTVEKAAYHTLLGQKLKVDELTSTIITLRKQYRELEKRYFILLTSNPDTAKKLVELGDYANEAVRD